MSISFGICQDRNPRKNSDKVHFLPSRRCSEALCIRFLFCVVNTVANPKSDIYREANVATDP